MSTHKNQFKNEGLERQWKAAALARVFSPIVLMQLSDFGKSKLLGSAIKESEFIYDEQALLKDCFDVFYNYIKSNYRNEYLYKNTIAKKILLGRHSLNTATMLTEFRILNSKADVVIINGTSHIYEIKTELDSLDRLENQLRDYSQFAEHVNIVTSENYINKLISITDPSIGLIVLTGRNTLKTIRKSKEGRNNINTSVIFDSLRKSEYLSIVKKHIGYIPCVPNTLMHMECRKHFEKISTDTCHDEMLTVLKNRNSHDSRKKFIHSVPDSLKAAAISSHFNKFQQIKIEQALSRPIGQCIS
ncbi:MAG: sce7726 family protein [Pseudomonadales bacterium]